VSQSASRGAEAESLRARVESQAERISRLDGRAAELETRAEKAEAAAAELRVQLERERDPMHKLVSGRSADDAERGELLRVYIFDAFVFFLFFLRRVQV
jgi:molecular chaperone GrpE (heat shock protein)